MASTRAADLGKEDARRLQRVNRVLVKSGQLPIPDSKRILDADIAVMRAIVDEADKRVSDAEDNFLDESTKATDPLRKDLLERISRNQTFGLPLLAPDNPFRRTHPHEAITQVLHGGRTYVLRVGPWLNPRLSTAGAAHDLAIEARLREFSSVVVSLFH